MSLESTSLVPSWIRLQKVCLVTLHFILDIFIQSYSNVVNQSAACLSKDVFVES